MTQETYCSFEQAKELKELGFPQEVEDLEPVYLELEAKEWWPISYRYYSLCTENYPNTNVPRHKEGDLYDWHINLEKGYCVRKTLSIVKKWINEEFGVFIYVVPRAFDIETKKQRDYQYSIYYWDNMEDCEVNFDTEDDALSAAIDKAIKQIKFDKERGVFDN